LVLRRNPELQGELWKNYFDVVILPPSDVRDYAIELSKRLNKYGANFVLGKRRYIPHLSLHHIPVAPENFQPFCDAVKEITAAFAGGEVRLKNIETPLLMTENPSWLRKLHREVVRKTNPYFDPEHEAPLRGMPFKPHITLTSFDDKNVVDGIPPLTFKAASFRVDAIHICELGPSHTCHRIVARFPVLM
jgi:2'-5' RNA ligase